MVFRSWRRSSKDLDWDSDLIRKLDPNVIANLPIGYLEHAPPEVLARLPGQTLASLPPSTLAPLPTETLIRLPLESLSLLPSESLARLPPGAISTLPPEVLGRLDRLPLDVVNGLPGHVVRNLPRSLLAELPPETLKRLPPDILLELAPTALANFPPETLSSVMFMRRQLPSDQRQTADSQQSRTLPPSAEDPVEVATRGPYQPQPPRQQQEHGAGVAQLTVPGQLGRSKSVNNLVPSMQERNTGGAQNKVPSTRLPRIDNNARIAQKRASYRHLRDPSREEILHATTVPGSGASNTSQASKLQVLSPLGAVVAEAKDLRRVPQDRRSRSDGVRRSPSFSEPARRSGPVPPPKRPLSPDRAVPISSQRHSPNATLPRDESRVPSSGSHKSVQRQRSLRQRPADGKPEQGALGEGVDGAQRPLSFDERATSTRLSDGLGSSNKETNGTQLEISLRERDKLIVELQEARDHQTSRVKHYMAQSIQANRELSRQKDYYETQLADIRNKLASEQARQEQNVLLMSKSHEEKLKTQENSHHQRTKQLKLELLAQKSSYDKRLHEERDKLQAELGMVRQELREAKRQYEAQLEGQKNDAVNEKSTQDRETEKRVAQHQAQLASLQQKHKTDIDALTEKLSIQATAHEQQVAILNGQLEHQDADYRLQIAQLIDKHANEIQKQKEDHQVELAAQNDKSSAHMGSLGQQYVAQVQLERNHHQRELQTLADGHRHAIQQQNLEHSRMLESLRAESGDYIRQASDDKLEGMFRQLKVAVEVVAEPFNLGLVVIQPGGRLDPTGILAREKGMQRHLLRSLVWSKIADGFFSAPFGFGVLGSGEGKQMLFELFMQWRKLLPAWQSNRDGLPQPEAEASDASSLDLCDLWRDRESNRWRSATFQSILTVVTARRETKLPYQEAKPAVDSPYFRNRAAVRAEILGLLNEATNGQVGKEIEEKVDEVTFLASALALEIGVHRAYLALRFPKQGEKVAIGRDFVDCEDGDPARRLSDEVELVVCPQFVKVGDGRNDLTTSKSIFRGEIYPVRDYEDDARS